MRDGRTSSSSAAPPTPLSGTFATPKISLTRSRSPSAASSSSNDHYYDADDGDVQTKRRSMFRSAGTASSPDLATLVRKAKERNVMAQAVAVNEKQWGKEAANASKGMANVTSPRDSSSTTSRTRQRSSTTVRPDDSDMQNPQHRGKLVRAPKPVSGPVPKSSSAAASQPISSDWVVTSPRPRSDTLSGKGKSSVRAKTSAFLGKIMGQNSVRDRSRVDPFSSTPVTPSYFGASFNSDAPPPVPPLPGRSTNMSPIHDIFSTAPGTPDTGKPLPPIHPSPGEQADVATDEDDDNSVVLVDFGTVTGHRSNRGSSPDRTIKRKTMPRSTPALDKNSSPRRRSMSVSDADLNAVMASDQPQPTQRKDWESNLRGIICDFKGELSQLDPVSSSSLDLQDPSTPRSQTFVHIDQPPSSVSIDQSSGRLNSHLHLNTSMSPASLLQPDDSPTPTSTLADSPEIPSRALSPVDDDVPSRSSSLQTPATTASGSSTFSKRAGPSSVKYGPRQLRTSSTGLFTPTNTTPIASQMNHDRLRVQHRSTASSSEPSLLHVRDDDRLRDKRSVRLVTSTVGMNWSEATSPALSICLSSQTDLTGEDNLSRFASSAPSRLDDAGQPDIDRRGKELATKCWREDEEFLAKEKIAEWLGGTGLINKMALRHYVDFFDFSGLRLDVAFRRLCAKLYLKAETQQVDRILEEFSRRYWETNPGTVYGCASVVHAVSYSLLLLNTDLHVAELAQRQRMSRNQFVRNTLAAIQAQIRPNGNERASTPDLTHDDGSSIRGVGSDGSDAGGNTVRSRGKRSGSVNSWNSVSRDLLATPLSNGTSLPQLNKGGAQVAMSESSLSVHEPRAKTPSMHSVIYGRNFDTEMEGLLKEMYNAIKSQQILQPIGHLSAAERASTSSLSPGPHHSLHRQRSQRGQNDRIANLKRGSMRGIQTLFAQSGASPYSSNSSIDGRISPSPSFGTSAHEVMAASTSSFLAPTLGFASNLSHTIIREAHEDDDRSIHSNASASTNVSISDEELALLGAPWAKEGMLCRKHYWESENKRAKSKNWLDVFVVIQKGELSMFTFGEHGGGSTTAVGGGNWLANAHSVGTISLLHSLARAFPPPGYNRQRPYCFVLTLASGAVYFFQAGTEELVNEWVSTCNYWAARQSKEPLAGGVSNMEYGWNRLLDSANHPDSQDDTRDTDRSDSLSLRSSRSNRSIRSRLSKKDFSLRSATSPYDRLIVHDWKPPMPSSVPSVHDEESQLEAMQRHVTTLKSDLKQHNDLRAAMAHMYQNRSSNGNKAMANWEKKSKYLLEEIVKYDSYVDSLKGAMSLRLKKRGEKALERALSTASAEGGEGGAGKGGGRWRGYPEEATIPEGEEPPPTPGVVVHAAQGQHRRESAMAEASGG